MVYTPVGIKCRECAAPTRGMVRQGKPSQYIGAALAGLGASLVGWLILGFTIRGSLLVNIVLGYLIGEAVRRGARGNRGPAFMAIASITALFGVLVSRLGLTPMGFLLAAVTAGVAAYRLSE